MDFNAISVTALAQQLRHPTGDAGKQVGEVMAQYNAQSKAFVFECLDIRPNDSMLEIGFGPGEAIAEAARRAPEGFIAGIDQSQTMLDMATKRNHRAIMEERVQLTLGTADTLPYDDETFDVVFAVNVFHFWPDARTELAECRRVLKTNGTILFYVTHPSSWLPGLEKTGVFVAREPEAMQKMLQEATFRNIHHRLLTSTDGTGFVVFGSK